MQLHQLQQFLTGKAPLFEPKGSQTLAQALFRRIRGFIEPIEVPIRSLNSSHRQQMAWHLLQLDPQDRYLRFGYSPSDAQVVRYVEGIDFNRDEIVGIFNRRLELIAMAHLAFPDQITEEASTEFGVSVLRHARGRQYGKRLFSVACTHARNRGIHHMVIHALSENEPMLNIARSAGASLMRDGPDSEASLQLPNPSLESHINEFISEEWALADYSMKRQLRLLSKFKTQTAVLFSIGKSANAKSAD